MLGKIKWRALVVAAFWLVASVAIAQTDTPPKFERGPIAAKVTDRSTLQVPEGYVWFGPDAAKALLEKMGNYPQPSLRGLVTAPQADWFIVVSNVDAGYVQDDDAKNWDADGLLASIKEGTAADNEKRKAAGAPELLITGWAEKPHYDIQTHKVSWAVSHRSGGGAEDVNFNTLTLGRYGYISMNLVTSLERLPSERTHVDLMLANLSFDEGSRYADFSSTTDKVAAFGLAALIGGIAVKAGLFAKFWAVLLPILLIAKKFVVYIVFVVGAGLWRLVKGRRKAPAPGD